MQRAIVDYPKFVSAHVGLGLAYVDQEDTGHARSEFEAAAKLDDKFPDLSAKNTGQKTLKRARNVKLIALFLPCAAATR